MRSTTKLFGVLFLVAAAGCATPIQYTADEGLVAKSNIEETRNKTREVLLRAAAPQITSIEFTDDYITVGWTQAHMGAFYQTVHQQFIRQLVFTGLGRYEIYGNNYVFLYDTNKNLIFQPLFATQEDAKSFADHIWSLRSHRVNKQ